MNGIYTLGVSPGTVIRNSHIHEVDANHCGGWGIYQDEGSTHLLVQKNIIDWREGELLSNNWKDVRYTFYAHPKDKSGTQTLTNTFEFDWDLYFNPREQHDEVKWAGIRNTPTRSSRTRKKATAPFVPSRPPSRWASSRLTSARSGPASRAAPNRNSASAR